jgi:hypothetical protein
MKLNDADADAFFRQGDEGTYSGGPGDSIPAGVVNVFDDLDEEALPRLTAEQIERRDRYTRLVKGLVSTLAIGALLAFGVRAAGLGDDEAPTIRAAASPETRVEPVAVAGGSGARTTPEHATTSVVEPSAPVATQSEVEALPEKHEAATASSKSAKSSKPVQASFRRSRTRPEPAAMPASKAPAAVPVHSSPPTAYFPD